MRLLFLNILCLFTFPTWARPPEPLIMGVGEVKTWPISRSGDVRVGDSKILKVVDNESHLLLMAKKPGTTQLVLADRVLSVQVLEKMTLQVFHALTPLVKDFLGLEVRLRDNNIVVAGHLYRFSDWLALAEKVPTGTYTFAAECDEDVIIDAENFFRDGLAGLGVRHFHWNREQTGKLTISDEHLSQKEPLQKYFSPFGIKLEFSKSQIELRPLIKVQLRIVETTKSFASEFGLTPSGEMTVQVLPETLDVSDFTATVNAEEGHSKGHLVASPYLLTRSGEPASSHSGGEFPLVIRGFKSKSVTWKKHGLLLNITPHAGTMGAMTIHISAELSSLDMGQAFDGVPGLKTHRIETQLNMKSSRTLAISGLERTSTGETQLGLRWLTQIPLLGRLFSGQFDREETTETLVFLTPEILPLEASN